jgi:hypothetical protein
MATPRTPRRATTKTRHPVGWIVVPALAVLSLLPGCGGSDGAIDLDTINPLVQDLALEPGARYELTFDPKQDDLEIAVGDTPPGISASVAPGPSDGSKILVIEVADDITTRGAIEIPLDVVSDGETTTVLWPFDVTGG